MSEVESPKRSKVTNAPPGEIARFVLGEMAGPYPGYIGPQVMPPPPPPPTSTIGMSGRGLLDPASNNQPLQFNKNKGKPPQTIPGSPGEMMIIVENGADKKVKDVDERWKDNLATSSASAQMAGPMQGMMSGMMGPGPMGYGPMMGPDPSMMDPSMMDPSMIDPSMMMNPMMFNQFGGYMGPPMGQAMHPVNMPKEMLTFKSCVLYPPPPNAPPPTTRERPPGCRTIFVGGLPDNITEEIIREVFDSCGEITSVRVSKKNFAHIRFEFEESVDKALYISGYRMKIDDKDDKPNTGRLHVDYAQARDDLYEWECKQRALAREMRHRQRIEEDRLRPPSPPPIVHYSEHEASNLMESLKSDENFTKSTQMLVTWLERGDCNRRSANTFYSMVQSVNAHSRRLLTEKGTYDQEYEEMKVKFRQRLEALVRQFEQIEKVFLSATKQKAWDHFSKAQRKNLEIWKKQAQEMCKVQKDDFFKDREEAEMEMSDSEDNACDIPAKKSKKEESYNAMGMPNEPELTKWQNEKLREENDQLRCQLEAYKNEVDLLKHEASGSDEKDKQIRGLQQALQGMQQQLIKVKQDLKGSDELLKVQRQTMEAEKLKAEAKLRAAQKAQKESDDAKEEAENATAAASEDDYTRSSAAPAAAPITITQQISERDARLIGLISTFLHVHPFGASVDYIISYLNRLDITIRTSEIEDLLESLPTVFRQDLHGVGASIERRWKYLGFDTV